MQTKYQLLVAVNLYTLNTGLSFSTVSIEVPEATSDGFLAERQFLLTGRASYVNGFITSYN